LPRNQVYFIEGFMSTILIVGAAACAMMIMEIVVPGRRWPWVGGWWPRAIALNLVQAGMVFVAGVTWDRWFAGASLWNLEDVLGHTGGAIAGYLVITFVYYWWHRARHEISILWRIFHQMHHSPQRIEIVASFYKHPVEIAFNSALSSAILYLMCGLSPEGATLAVLLTALAELFYHWNVRTPYWLGFIVQRPESHCVHHRRDWHRQNFSDLPLWDMLFGTFHNPKEVASHCGFDPGLEAQVGAMLRGVDVHRSRKEATKP
jgi:sterol desaturase/sphingolipid hydroxylase (fatty acid hydroxylase superfamily)